MKYQSKLILFLSLIIFSFQACTDQEEDNLDPEENVDPNATCKILRSIDADGTTQFEYNGQSQIVKHYIDDVLLSEITYNTDGKISTQTFPDRSEFKVETYTYNANGTIAKYVGWDEEKTFYYNGGINPAYCINFEDTQWPDTSFFTYANGNVTKIIEHEYYNGGSSKTEVNFGYDTMKLPTYLFNWSSWMNNSNNVIETEYISYDAEGNIEDSEKYTSTMEYNAAGYPTKGSTGGWKVTLEYECE